MNNLKLYAKSFFEGAMIGTGVAFWTLYLFGRIVEKLGNEDEDDISDLPEDVQEMLS